MQVEVKKKYLLIIVLVLIVGVFGTTLAYFNANVIGSPAGSSGVTTGTFELTVSDAAVNVTNAAPIYDEYYATQAYHKTFTVTNSNTSTLNVCAKIVLNITTISESLKSTNFKYKIVSSDGRQSVGNFSSANTTDDLVILTNNFLEVNETQTFNLYIWISYVSGSDQMSMLGTSFAANVKAIGNDMQISTTCSE